MKNKEAICEMLEDQEREILKKGSMMDEHDLKNLYRISAIVTDYETREAMKKAESKGGYSQHYPPHMWMNEGSYDGSSMRMSHEASHRRGRDANTGRYVSRGGSYDGGGSYEGSYEGSYDSGYSRGESDEQFKEGLRKLMNKARTEEERNIVRHGLDLLS